mmetsp:Transcript_14514/g.47681  ORF Transcript_14514/g.47681 Transcript_14514/m.47681 type:complete len:135 (-) Transcript_14514:337-741(-)
MRAVSQTQTTRGLRSHRLPRSCRARSAAARVCASGEPAAVAGDGRVKTFDTPDALLSAIKSEAGLVAVQVSTKTCGPCKVSCTPAKPRTCSAVPRPLLCATFDIRRKSEAAARATHARTLRAVCAQRPPGTRTL